MCTQYYSSAVLDTDRSCSAGELFEVLKLAQRVRGLHLLAENRLPCNPELQLEASSRTTDPVLSA